ncbi:hypothetical protein [Sneathiella sp.]|jgi:hypothetical protein|uniref:hypothetical protein n=1 Tax=Sneathiella sp. TaxID=1964365 RepID=UPI0025D8E366|nr:hypothetical protein [Sneathiella sp.]
MSEKYLDQEFILRSDGKFYKRTTVVSPVHNADQILSAVKDNGIPVIFPFVQTISIPELNKNIPTYSMVYSHQPHIVTTFVKLNEFPFPESWLWKQAGQPHYSLGIGNTGDREIPDTRSIIWRPTLDGLELFIAVTLDTHSCQFGSPILFVLDETKTPYVPNIANVFDDGRICTGGDWRQDFSRGFELDTLTGNIYNLYRSPCNNDLRNSEREREYMRFTERGDTLCSLPEPGLITDNDHRFYMKHTNSKVIDFVQHVKF